MATVSLTMPVTLDAAEKLPILSGRSRILFEDCLQVFQIDPPVAIFGDGHHIGEALAPRDLVGVVLVRSDEDHRTLVLGDPVGQIEPCIEIPPAADVEDLDELVDGAGGACAAEDHHIVVTAAHRFVDDPPRILAKTGRLETRGRGLGVGVGIKRHDLVPDEVLDEVEGTARRRVIGIGHPAGAERADDGPVIADDSLPDALEEFGDPLSSASPISRSGRILESITVLTRVQRVCVSGLEAIAEDGLESKTRDPVHHQGVVLVVPGGFDMDIHVDLDRFDLDRPVPASGSGRRRSPPC